jgi:hypothetical protein
MDHEPTDIEISIITASVKCQTCGCDIPLDEAVVPEALPYVVNFCGLECYSRWRSAATQAHIPTLSVG